MPDDFAPADPFDESDEPGTEQPQAPQGPPPVVPPQQVTSYTSRTDAAVGLVWAGLGTAAGAWLLGPLGALAGLAAVGSVRNGVRAAQNWKSASQSDRQEATKSATVSLFGAGIAGMLAYTAVSGKNDE